MLHLCQCLMSKSPLNTVSISTNKVERPKNSQRPQKWKQKGSGSDTGCRQLSVWVAHCVGSAGSWEWGWCSYLSNPSPRGLAPCIKDRLLCKLADTDNRPFPTTIDHDGWTHGPAGRISNKKLLFNFTGDDTELIEESKKREIVFPLKNQKQVVNEATIIIFHFLRLRQNVH